MSESLTHYLPREIYLVYHQAEAHHQREKNTKKQHIKKRQLDE